MKCSGAFRIRRSYNHKKKKKNNWIRFALVVETFVVLIGSAILFRKLLEIGVLTAKTFPIYVILMTIFTIIFVICTKLQNLRNRDKIKA